MKNLITGLIALAVLVPAAEVRQEELERGRNALVTMTQAKIKAAAEKNKKHIWISLTGYNFSQKFALQKELESKGYTFDIPMFGSTWIGW